MGSINRLLTPLSYLRIKRQDKVFDEFVIPGVLTVILMAILLCFSGRIPIFSEKGIISVIVSYLQIVSGFYIASLAAVATFNKDSMDKAMPGIPVVLPSRKKRRGKPEALSRRRFLCFMFGYLSFVSLFLYFGGSALVLLAPHLKLIVSGVWLAVLKWSVVAIYMFMTANMLVTTLLGLYYMTDRIHRKEAAFVTSIVVSTDDEEEDDDEEGDEEGEKEGKKVT